MKKNFVITAGDRDGIGLEISVKALARINPDHRARFLLSTHQQSLRSVAKREWQRLARKWNVVAVYGQHLEDAYSGFCSLKSDELLVFVDSSRNSGAEARWVESAAQAAVQKSYGVRVHGLVTGPVSKERFIANHSKDMGHTGLLGRIAKTAVYQGYIGPKLGVVLASDHVELRNVQKSLTPKRLAGALQAAKSLRQLMALQPQDSTHQVRTRRKKKSLPIAVLGLNPHAGENGRIGQFEKSKFRLPRGFIGPLPADSAFGAGFSERFSCVLAMYHDQGLIPFKMLHGQDSGFQVSLGLPFTRTSVDHGTAKAIYGKNSANFGSMCDAIQAAMRIEFT